jgi:hypothetical protein
MQMIWHQYIIAYKAGVGLILPNLMKRALHARLRQPRRPLLSADGQENPIRSVQPNMNPFGWRASSWFKKLTVGHRSNL